MKSLDRAETRIVTAMAGRLRVREQHIAVFGGSGSGKTVLVSSFYGAAQEQAFLKDSDFHVIADDTGQGNRLRQNYLGGGSPVFGGAGVAFGAPGTNFDGKRSFNKFTPRASLSFKPTPDHTLYASYSQGFKGGGFDPRGVGVNAPDTDGNGTRSDDEIAAKLPVQLRYLPELIAA